MTALDSHWTNDEARNVDRVRRHLKCITDLVNNPSALSELEALLAPDFCWVTPSMDRNTGGVRTRDDYLSLFHSGAGVQPPYGFVSLHMQVHRLMADGAWVSGETESTGERADGLSYENLYHQAWCFNSEGKIVEYRIYNDTARIGELEVSSRRQSIELLLRTLTMEHADGECGLVMEEDATWVCEMPGGRSNQQRLTSLLSRVISLGELNRRRITLNHKRTFSSADAVLVEARSEYIDRPGSPASLHHLVFDFHGYSLAGVREMTIGDPLFFAAEARP